MIDSRTRFKDFVGLQFYELLEAEDWAQLAFEDIEESDKSEEKIKKIAISYLNALITVSISKPQICIELREKIRSLLRMN